MWGFFPIVTVLSYNSLPPLSALALNALFGALFFAIVLSFRKTWKDIINRKALPDMLRATLFTGILYYIFTFIGLQHTSVGNMSIIALSETLFSYLLFNMWRKEYMSGRHIFGAFCMVGGALIVLTSNFTHFQIGDTLILLAAAVAPFGNFYQQKVRKTVSSEALMFVRSIVSAPVVFLVALGFGERLSVGDVQASLVYLFVGGFFLLGLSKIFWIEGIHRISVTKANALSTVSPLVTLLLAWLILKDIPTVWQLSAIAPIIIGTVLLSKPLERLK